MFTPATAAEVADFLATGEVLTSTIARTLLDWHAGPPTTAMRAAVQGVAVDLAELSREVCTYVGSPRTRQALTEWIWRLEDLADRY